MKVKSMNFDIKKLARTIEPAEYSITDEKIEIITLAHTDLIELTHKNDILLMTVKRLSATNVN